MYSLKVKNKDGLITELTNNPAYSIKSIDGIDPPDATINTSKNAGADGSVFNSATVNDRQITLTMAINYPAEQNRIELYKYFKSKYPVTLYYKNDSRDVYIEGHVQSIQVGYFEKKQTFQVVISCSKPFFLGYYNDIQDFSTVIPLFEFPFDIPAAGIEFSEIEQNIEKSIMNKGDVDTGVLITIRATGAVDTPKIFNVETGEYYILDINLLLGDEITINTRIGEKSVTLLRDGVRSVIIGYLREGSTWFQLKPGDNVFTVAAESGIAYMYTSFEVMDLYEGV